MKAAVAISLLLMLLSVLTSSAVQATSGAAKRVLPAPPSRGRAADTPFCRWVTGWQRGKPILLRTVNVDDHPVEVLTGVRYVEMQEAARRDGVYIRVLSGYRTHERQTQLFLSPHSAPVARPGYSRHQSGHALDLNTASPNVYAWLRKRANRFSFVPFEQERWHWYRDLSKPASADEKRRIAIWCKTGALPRRD